MSNRFRPAHRPLSDAEGALIGNIKETAEHLAQLFDQAGGRECALANTHLETAVMWAVKGITK